MLCMHCSRHIRDQLREITCAADALELLFATELFGHREGIHPAAPLV